MALSLQQRKAGAWLDKVRNIDGYRAALEDVAAEQLAAAERIGGIAYDDVRVKVSRKVDAIPDIVAAHMELSEAVRLIARDACDMVSDAVKRINELDNPKEAECLTRYYINRADDWNTVANAMYYTFGGIMKLRKRALLNLWDHMPHTERARVPLSRPCEYD